MKKKNTSFIGNDDDKELGLGELKKEIQQLEDKLNIELFKLSRIKKYQIIKILKICNKIKYLYKKKESYSFYLNQLKLWNES